MRSDTPMLEAGELSAGYPNGRIVVRDITLTLEPRGLLCLVGPNGAGKSTLLSVLAGILPPASGVLRLGGTPLKELDRRHRAKRIGFLPQIVRPSVSYSVYELVALGRFAHGAGWTFETDDDRAAVMKALEITRADHLVDRPFDALSGGERQRVLIASVLVGEPDVLLLDEPTASLDIGHGADVFDALRFLAGSGRAICVVTHDLNLAGQFADSIGVMAEGALVNIGPPEAVLTPSCLTKAYGDGVVLVTRPDSDVPAVLPRGRR